MEMPLPELLDRFTIVQLKSERISNEIEKIKELEFYKNEIINYKNNGCFIDDNWIKDLYEINSKIWDLESDIRSGKEGKLGLEEVGRRAIEIRNLNKIRVSIKNTITEKTGSGFKDIKINHVSE